MVVGHSYEDARQLCFRARSMCPFFAGTTKISIRINECQIFFTSVNNKFLDYKKNEWYGAHPDSKIMYDHYVLESR